jgi:flagellar basal-body rod modification protein FlgD
MSMISEIGGSSATQWESAKTEKSANGLGQDAFLKILMAQLQNQDPLKPMEGTEFTAQLAQFSSLEQLFTTNRHLESIKSGQDDSGRLDALNLIGKEVLTDGDRIALTEGTVAKAAFRIDKSASCTALITDGAGNTIRKIDLGTLEGGEHALLWDGRNNAGNLQEPGTYRFNITATDTAGDKVQVDQMVWGRVDRVSVEGQSPVAFVGEIPIDVSQIKEIRSPRGATESGEGGGLAAF